MVTHCFKLYALAACLVVSHAWGQSVGQSVGQSARWHDQIDNVDPRRDAIAGQWRKTADGLRTDAATSARIAIPVKLPREYDFRSEFTRHSGQHSIALFFTSGSGRATFEIDAWGKHLAGIQQIDGQTMQKHAVKSGSQRLENGRKYTAEVRVRTDSVTVLLDDQVLATYRGDGSNLSLHSLWQMSDQVTLGVGAYQSETTFHRLGLRAVSAEPIAASQPKVAMSKRPAKIAKSPARPSLPRKNAGSKRVLIVIADQHFFYREYADPRQELEQAGFTVDVAAGNRSPCFPHANSGQGADRGGVRPDLTLAEVDPSRYEAIVFSGGWGASMYQFAFAGRYDNATYNGNQTIKKAANQLINAFAAQDKYICGICNGVSVLAWSRVNGKSLLDGKRVTAPTRAAPSGVYNGRRGAPSIRWHVEQNGGRLVPAGSIGHPGSRADDVLVDGRVITAEDDQSAREAGRQLAKLLSAT